ncbi:MAG TPA: DnaJ domain-containing protein [Chloroflexota bacterium]|nr:DnaJ domain-containing protein [Chloroflexota bacterium]
MAVSQAVDYYRVLQVDPDAEPEVIAAAYRKLATKYHPDVNPSSEAAERMREINIAYGILADPAKRAEYDRARGARWIPRFGAGPSVQPHAPASTVQQLVRTLVLMLISSVIFSLVARMFGGLPGMTIALLIVLVVVLWKGGAIMRYFGKR